MKTTLRIGIFPLFLAGLVLVLFSSCKKEEEVKIGYPQVTASPVENITGNSAVVSATVTSDGGSPVTSRGFQYSQEVASIYGNTIQAGTGTGSFTAELNGLTRNTTYYVRAFAANKQYMSYSDTVTFTTGPGNVIFNVDMSYAFIFNPETDEVYLSGEFTGGWAMPGTDTEFRMTPTTENNMIYTITLQLDPGDHFYKYFRVIDQVPSWDYGEWTGDPNRTITVTDTLQVNDKWGWL